MISVSIGIPYTDQTEELALAVKSVLNQTYEDWELILLGDGPSPGASAVAKSFRDRRVRVYEQPERSGLAAALNRIAHLARFPLLARMDGDDLMHPLRIERQVRKFESDPDLDVLGTMAFLIDGDTELVGAFTEPELPRTPRGFLRSNAFSHPTVMGKTSWFRANPYDEHLLRAQDKELWLRTCQTSKFAKLPDRLMYYRVPRDMSSSRLRRNESYNRLILRRYITLENSLAARILCLIRSYCKEVIFLAATAGRVAEFLHDRKWTALGESEHEEAAAELDRILSL